ncbi:hypothetical protein BJI69_14595 [Luteibacter rhizovicinus DSM 16549]|uniref:Uncharacterized protein n=1 Tax=Luteibacter rhizovicinus DSM 16549 TaxID=1440763 RepID=A0A0G9H9U8_9GAMM|nr:hypothetical protein [Luteibacter rhizovicinus]APG05001.1 hypothetical protein BJI69_14595 [Luteibacter rhizovicinus DSM 16549]KLD64472.1 hypothetical protein Y883_17915 [Luteibacter rhizovicinus DSM 16549]KLD80205.1 hypothetical protein Y886_00300 [Xanthomonas hyacinthi DSM 19077]
MLPRNVALFAATLLATSFAHAATPAPASTTAKAEISQLVDAFKAAIIAKDGTKLGTLFVAGNSSWFSAMDSASLERTRAKKPDAKRVRAEPEAYKGFTSFVGSTTHAIEETFDNVRIDTDGIVGSVYFDYVFLLDRKPTNHGNETWQVVRTDEGWKINAMLYSVILDPAK